MWLVGGIYGYGYNVWVWLVGVVMRYIDILIIIINFTYSYIYITEHLSIHSTEGQLLHLKHSCISDQVNAVLRVSDQVMQC